MNVWLQRIHLGRKTALLVAFAAGSLYAVAFAPFYFWPVNFFSFPILYGLIISSMNAAQAVWRGFFFGYGFFMAGTWWIGKALLVDAAKFGWMLPFSVLGLSAVIAVWFMPFSYLVFRARRVMTPLLFAVLWVIIEYSRGWGMLGFPWNLAGYISLRELVMAQGASLVGIYGLSFAVVWLGLLPVYYCQHGRRAAWVATSAAIALVAAAFLYGAERLHLKTEATTVRLRVIQPNVPQEIKGTPQGAHTASLSLGRMSAAESQGVPPDITIWPETAYPYNIRTDQPVLVPEFQGVLITGAVRAIGYRPITNIWNSMVALTPGGDILASYDKHQLVPFGEFVPLRSILPLDKITPGELDFSRGEGIKTLTLYDLPAFSPLICYEGIFPALVVDRVNRPAWMLNLTNDAWYGVTPGPYQHFDMVRMRTIEQGLPMVRAANSGISAVIDSRGRIVSSLSLGAQGYIDAFLPSPDKPTVYASFGYGILIGALSVVVLLHAVFLRRPKKLNNLLIS